MKRRVWLALIAGAAMLWTSLGVSGDAVAQAADKYRKQHKQYSSRLDKLAEKDEWGVSKSDRERAREWLDNAKVLLAEGGTDKAAMLLRQVGDILDLIQAEVRAKEINAAAEGQEEKYIRLKEEVRPELEQKIEELRQRKKRQERKIEKLRR